MSNLTICAFEDNCKERNYCAHSHPHQESQGCHQETQYWHLGRPGCYQAIVPGRHSRSKTRCIIPPTGLVAVILEKELS
jgi:hypothetical protein